MPARKKANPGDDMISDLLVTGELADGEASNMAMLLLLAGRKTTANMPDIGTFTLLQHPDQLKILQEEPGVIDNAVEELMPCLSILQIGPFGPRADSAPNSSERNPKRVDGCRGW